MRENNAPVSESWDCESTIGDIRPTKTRDYTSKSDQGKTDWTLLPWRSIEKAAEIMTQAIRPKDEGGEGYARDSWRTVPGGFWRYWAAMHRHILRRYLYDEVIDPKSGKPHMAHLICNAAFVCEMDLENNGSLSEALKKLGLVDKLDSFYERDI